MANKVTEVFEKASHKAQRVAASAIVDRVLSKLYKDRTKAYLDIVDLVENFWKGDYPHEVFDKVREAIKDPDNRWIKYINSIIDEIFEVINASPYETLWQNSDEYRNIFYSKLVPDTYNHYSSTHQDIKRKIPTEIDSLNGKVIELGEQFNIDISTNKLIYNLIKAIESTF